MDLAFIRGPGSWKIAPTLVEGYLFTPLSGADVYFWKGNVMAAANGYANAKEADPPPAISNIAGVCMAIIILSLASVIWFQQGQLSDAIKTLAIVVTKCAAK